eukprot:jgi/Botrbrau1/11901/Bobra.0171s0012.2
MPPLGLVSSPVKCDIQGFRRCINWGKEFLAEPSMLLGRQRHTFDGDSLCEITARQGRSGPSTSKAEESDLDWSVVVGSAGEHDFTLEERCRRLPTFDSTGGPAEPFSFDENEHIQTAREGRGECSSPKSSLDPRRELPLSLEQRLRNNMAVDMSIHFRPPTIRPIKTPRGDPYECPHPKLRRFGEPGDGTESPYAVQDSRAKRDGWFAAAAVEQQGGNIGISKRAYHKSRLSRMQSASAQPEVVDSLPNRFLETLKAGLGGSPTGPDIGGKWLASSVLQLPSSRSSTPFKQAHESCVDVRLPGCPPMSSSPSRQCRTPTPSEPSTGLSPIFRNACSVHSFRDTSPR